MANSMRYAWRRIIVRDPDLSDATRRVLLELESYADPDGTNAHPGVQRLAENLHTPSGKHGHVSDRTARTALATGVERGFIECTAPAPRGRGNRRASVYRLTFPAGVRPEKEAPSTAAIAPGKVAASTAANTAPNSSSKVAQNRQSTTEWRQSGLPTTSPLTPVPNSADTDRHLSNAGAREADREAASTIAPPTESPDPTRNPLAWIDHELPGGFRIGERNLALKLLEVDTYYATVRFTLLQARNMASRNIFKSKVADLRGSQNTQLRCGTHGTHPEPLRSSPSTNTTTPSRSPIMPVLREDSYIDLKDGEPVDRGYGLDRLVGR